MLPNRASYHISQCNYSGIGTPEQLTTSQNHAVHIRGPNIICTQFDHELLSPTSLPERTMSLGGLMHIQAPVYPHAMKHSSIDIYSLKTP
jgi:hypothetical protein